MLGYEEATGDIKYSHFKQIAEEPKGKGAPRRKKPAGTLKRKLKKTTEDNLYHVKFDF
jgi:hypothetical protein